MDTINIVLMIILAAIIGFALGNSWGQWKIRNLLSSMLEKMTAHLRVAAEQKGENDAKNG